MADGLQVNNSAGNTIFDSSSITWLQVDQFTVAANTTVTKNYSTLSGFNVIAQQQMVGVPANNQESFAPKISVTGTSVTVAPYSGQSSVRVIVLVLAQG